MTVKATKIKPAFLTVQQTCQFLNIGKTLLYSRLSSEMFGVIPIRCGRKVLFPKSELQAYVHASTLAGDYIPRQKWQIIRNDYLKELKP